MKEIFVKIYPHGVDRDGNYTNPVRLIFNSVEERDKYVRKEYSYCKTEEDAFLSAIFRADRIRCKNNLMLKRAEFAKLSGFLGADNRWTKIDVEEINA